MNMESLNMSKLNLSVVAVPASQDETIDPPAVRTQDSQANSSSKYLCEYRDDIWKNLLEQEAEKPPIHLQSPQLEFRGTLVQQLRDVTKRLGLTLATLHSAVAHLDLFMDAHRLRADRLKHIALACLSLAAKSEEKFSRAPTLKTLSKISDIYLCGKVFKQLEWMVGQHIKWRLLAPTPVTFASLLAQFVVTDADMISKHPKFVKRFKRDGAKLLDAYLDLTLSDVRLKVVDSVDVGCACVACARADLGLVAWPPALAAAATRRHATVAPIARRLQRMMQILKEREKADSEVDLGYGSAKTTPNQTPSASPKIQTPQITSTTSAFPSTSLFATCYNSQRAHADYVLDTSDTAFVPPPLPPSEPCHLASRECGKYCRYCRSSRMLDASLDRPEHSTPNASAAVKRPAETSVDLETRRYRTARCLKMFADS